MHHCTFTRSLEVKLSANMKSLLLFVTEEMLCCTFVKLKTETMFLRRLQLCSELLLTAQFSLSYSEAAAAQTQ